jgi:Replication protein
VVPGADDDVHGAFGDGVDEGGNNVPPVLLTRLIETKSQIVDGCRLKQPNPIRSEHCGILSRPEEEIFRHSGWAARRAKVFASMIRNHTSDRKQERFANCGANLWLEVRDDGKAARLRCEKCRDRCCVPCGGDRAATIVENLIQHTEGKDMRLLTFGLRHSKTPLTNQIDRLYRSFAELRRRVDWLARVKGGAAFLEVKLSKTDGLWHPHLHVLLEGSYFDQKLLSRMWHEVTGDSSIVHITRISDLGHASRYVTKYVTKPLDASVFASDAVLDEAMVAMRGRRLCLTFGSWRGFKLCDVEDDGHVWTSVGGGMTLWLRIRDGDAGAAEEAQRYVALCPAFGRWLSLLFGIGHPRSPSALIV